MSTVRYKVAIVVFMTSMVLGVATSRAWAILSTCDPGCISSMTCAQGAACVDKIDCRLFSPMTCNGGNPAVGCCVSGGISCSGSANCSGVCAGDGKTSCNCGSISCE